LATLNVLRFQRFYAICVYVNSIRTKDLRFYDLHIICFKSEQLAFYTVYNTHDLSPSVNPGQWMGEKIRDESIEIPDDGQK
jgi:hypothetical protein